MEAVKKVIPERPSSVPDEDNLDALIKRSEEFGKLNRFPIEYNLCHFLVKNYQYDPTSLLRNVNQTYPLVHERLLPTFAAFIELKKNRGTEVEKEIYKDMDLVKLIDRLLVKRPLMFVGTLDKHILRDGDSVDPSKKDWSCLGFDEIGTAAEKEPLVMRDYISYDEMKLSALLATCSPTATLNEGKRHNLGRKAKDGTFVKEAVIVGLVGTRPARENTMDFQDLRITPEQNTSKQGYFGAKAIQSPPNLPTIFAELYKIPYFPTFNELRSLKDPNLWHKLKSSFAPRDESLTVDHFVKMQDPAAKGSEGIHYFNKFAYEQRLKLTFETFLAEANHRAQLAGKKAYVHVVGIGLGVWKVLSSQQYYFVDTFGECLKEMSLEHVSDVDFSWIPVQSCCGTKNGDIFPNTDIKIHISMRDPYAPLEDGEDKLIVSSWAYDSNSYPGNEYWAGSLATSSDPAAACCTQVAELHNPLINVKMSGANLHIALEKGGEVVSIQEYWDRFLA